MNAQELDLNPLRDILTRQVPQDELQKSLIEDLSYNRDAFSITKSGKEFKALLQARHTSLCSECEQHKAQLTICLSTVKACGFKEDPKDMPSSYQFGGLRKSAFDYIPKMFSYDQRWPRDGAKQSYDVAPGYHSSDLTKMAMNPSQNTEEQCRQHMSKYNDCVRKYLRCKADCVFLEKLISSIDDKSSVKLSGQMLKLLV